MKRKRQVDEGLRRQTQYGLKTKHRRNLSRVDNGASRNEERRAGNHDQNKPSSLKAVKPHCGPIIHPKS